MAKWILSFAAIIIFCVIAYADDTRLGKDDFVSSSVGAIFDKLGQYTSGEKGILVEEEKVEPQGMNYEMDALGNKIPDKVVDTEEDAATGKPIFEKKPKI